MAPQQATTLMHWVQVIMLFIVTGLLSWVGIKVQNFSEFVARTEQIDKRQDDVIQQADTKMTGQEQKTNDHEKRIYYLEGMLPEIKQKKTRPAAGF